MTTPPSRRVAAARFSPCRREDLARVLDRTAVVEAGGGAGARVDRRPRVDADDDAEAERDDGSTGVADHDQTLQLEPRAVVVRVHPREEAAREGQALAAALRVSEHEQLFDRLQRRRVLAGGQRQVRQRRVRSRRPAFHHAQAPGHAEHREVGARRQRDGVRAWEVARTDEGRRTCAPRVREDLDRQRVLGPPRRLRHAPSMGTRRDGRRAHAASQAAHVLTNENEAVGADAEAAARDLDVPLDAVGAREPARRRGGRRARARREDADRDDREARRVGGEALAKRELADGLDDVVGERRALVRAGSRLRPQPEGGRRSPVLWLEEGGGSASPPRPARRSSSSRASSRPAPPKSPTRAQSRWSA